MPTQVGMTGKRCRQDRLKGNKMSGSSREQGIDNFSCRQLSEAIGRHISDIRSAISALRAAIEYAKPCVRRAGRVAYILAPITRRILAENGPENGARTIVTATIRGRCSTAGNPSAAQIASGRCSTAGLRGECDTTYQIDTTQQCR